MLASVPRRGLRQDALTLLPRGVRAIIKAWHFLETLDQRRLAHPMTENSKRSGDAQTFGRLQPSSPLRYPGLPAARSHSPIFVQRLLSTGSACLLQTCFHPSIPRRASGRASTNYTFLNARFTRFFHISKLPSQRHPQRQSFSK